MPARNTDGQPSGRYPSTINRSTVADATGIGPLPSQRCTVLTETPSIVAICPWLNPRSSLARRKSAGVIGASVMTGIIRNPCGAVGHHGSVNVADHDDVANGDEL